MINESESRDERRLLRRKRRQRNQALAYIALFIFVVIVIIGVIIGTYTLFGKHPKKVVDEETEVVVPEDTTPVIIEEPEPIIEPEPVDPYEELLNEMVDSYIDQMSLQEKVAQLFIVTPEQITGVGKVTVAGNTTKKALEKYTVGGLIYFTKNIATYDKFKEMLYKTMQYSKYPLFLGVDEEGGTVSRIGGNVTGVGKIESADKLGEQETQNTYIAYEKMGSYLEQIGINLNFAPVADLDTDINKLFDARSFGQDPVSVSEFVKMAVLGLKEHSLTVCLKHFPGHGATKGDSETGMAVTDRTLEEMRESEFLPFIAGIEGGADMVMIGQISVPQITGTNVPASLSKEVVTDILKNELGFGGIIITDAMNMPSITDYYLSGEAAVMALQAGVDMILMPEDFEAAYQAVLDAVTQGVLTEDRINESLRRIYRVRCAEMAVRSLDELENQE